MKRFTFFQAKCTNPDQIFLFYFLKLSLCPIVLINVTVMDIQDQVGPGLPRMGVLTLLHMCIQSVSLNVEKYILQCLASLTPRKTSCQWHFLPG